ncbi:hypothetical protein LNV23_17200, partial [Paucibacter sp. DJ1R-11]|uniref:hypothetical protein n=1 Tax=Paucibacter sp. DJ1R-11 TaxID=2893556 RepID=UPI0021E4CD46
VVGDFGLLDNLVRHHMTQLSRRQVAHSLCQLSIAMAANLSLAPPARAKSSSSVQVGSASIALPIPAGYSDPTARAPKLKSLLESSTIAQKKFLAGFVSTDDVEAEASGRDPNLRLYFVAQTLRAAELMTTSSAAFENTKKIIRDQFQTLAPLTGPALSELVERLTSAAGQTVAHTKVAPVGIFDETPASISVTAINTSVVSSGAATITDSTIVSATTALVRGKYIYLQVCSDLAAAKDVLENQDASRAWTRAILVANQ